MFLIGLVLTLTFSQPASGFPAAIDSVGLVQENGKDFILHEVEEQETLYSIARRYGVSITLIKKYNTGIEGTAIRLGEVLRIPKLENELTVLVAKDESPSNTSDYIFHLVREEETFYRLSKQYFLSVDDLKKANPDVDPSALSPGSYLKIPQVRTLPENSIKKTPISDRIQVPKPEEKIERTLPKEALSHVVVQGETLYGISKMYEKELSDLRIWNGLISDIVGPGQTLIVGFTEKSAETMVSETELVSGTTKPEPAFSIGSLKHKSTFDTYALSGKDLITENGVATWIENDVAGTDGYFVLHDTAPIGSIVRVKNLMNNRVIYAKVVGGIDPGITHRRPMLRLTANAVKALNARDARFAVEGVWLAQ